MIGRPQWSTRLIVVLLGLFYVIAFLVATPLAYFGGLWLSVSEGGWRTQVAAYALLVGWMALAVSGTFTWRFAKARQRSNLLMGIASCLVAAAAYAVVYAWGGRMLI